MTAYQGDPPMPVAGRAAPRGGHAQPPPPPKQLAASTRNLPLFAADSPVVVTARELAAAHAAPPGAPCPVCDLPSPCPTQENAAQVCQAAGVRVPQPGDGLPAARARRARAA